MALGTITIADKTVFGDKRCTYGTGVLTTGANYAANGEAIVAGDFGLNKIDYLQLGSNATNALLVVLNWDKANSKILAFESDINADQPLKEAEANDDFSTYIFNWMAIGS